MAQSKALQAREWQEMLRASDKPRYKFTGNFLNRLRNRGARGRQTVNVCGAESHQSLLAHNVNNRINATAHAKRRKAQRNLSNRDINYALLYGQIFHKAGAVIVHLREKDVPFTDRANSHCQNLVGTTVVMTTGEKRRVLTAYRNRHGGLRHIKCKPDYDRSPTGKRRFPNT